MSALTTIEYILIQSSPHRDGWDSDPQLADKYAALPPAFRAALAETLREVDSLRCARCGDGVGYALAENADGREVATWTATALARERDRPVALMCDECAPYVPA